MLKTGNPGSGLGGGTLVGSFNSPYLNAKHTEKNTIYDAFGGDGNRLYLGMMSLWQQYKEAPTPLLNATELSKQILEIDAPGATLDYDIPHDIEPIKVRANIVDITVDKIGRGQTKFPFITSEPLSPGDLVSLRTLRSLVQLRISTEADDKIERFDEGDGYKQQAYVASSDIEAYIPREFLEPGTFVFVQANPGGEKTDNYGSLQRNRRGVIRHSLQTGSAEIGLKHTVTSYGDMAGTNISTAASGFNLIGNYNYSKLSPGDPNGVLNYFNYTSVDQKTGKPIPITGSRAWVPTIIQKMIEELALNKEWLMTWSNGYSYIARGDQKVDVPTGYYPQVKQRGHYFEYYDTKDVYSIMKDMANQLFAGTRINPYDQELEFTMGIGAYIEALKAFQEYALDNNKFLIVNDGKNPITQGIFTGTSQNLSFQQPRVVSVHTPELGRISIKHNAALDYLDGDNEQQRYEGRYPASSYIIWIEDVTDSKFSNLIPKGASQNVAKGYIGDGNVVQIRPRGYEDTIHFYPGTSCSPTLKKFLGNNQIAVTKEKGFEVIMNTWAECLIKDASRIAIAEYIPKYNL